MMRLFTISVLALALVSCEGNTDRVRLVYNQSSTAVTVEADADWNTGIEITVQPGEVQELFMMSQLGGSDYIVHPYSNMDTLIIMNAAGDTCTINYADSLSWEYHVEERSRFPADWLHEYTVVVTDGDF